MPRKKQSSRKGTMQLPLVHQAGNSSMVGSSTCAQSASEKQIADAIQASKEMAMQRECYTSAVARAMRESRAIAEAEAEEALQLKLALEASLAESDEKNLGLGLKPTPPNDFTEDLVNATNSTIQVCNSLGGSVAKSVETLSPCQAEPCVRTVLKVLHESDTRRLRVQWAADASSIEVLAAVSSAVEDGFSLNGAEVSYTLKYRDDEGDLCTLVEGTVADFLQVARHAKAFKIVLEIVKKVETATGIATLPSIARVPNIDAALQEDFVIGTPPSTPRETNHEASSSTIEDDYEGMWSFVEVDD